MKTTGRIKQVRLDLASKKYLVTVELDEQGAFQSEADTLTNSGIIDIEFKKHRQKRSLSANAYAWVLIDRISEKTGILKENVYRDFIRNVGGNSTTIRVPVDACDKLLTEWTHNGLGWFGEVVHKTERFSDVTLYYGSSTFDTHQMSRLIELVIQECEQDEIETDTLERIAYLEGLLNQ